MQRKGAPVSSVVRNLRNKEVEVALINCMV